MDDAVFVVTVTNLASLAFLTASATFGVTVPTFGFGSGRADPEPGPAGQQRALHPESNNNVKVHFAFLDLVSQIFLPTSSAPAALAASAFAPWVNRLRERNGQYRAAVQLHHVRSVRFTSVDAEVNSYVHAFYELAVASSFSSAIASLMSYCLVHQLSRG